MVWLATSFDWGAVGGVLLIIGAFALYRGHAMLSILIYFIADLCWLFLSFSVGNTLGVVLIGIGMLLGMGVFIKMNRGIFVKNLHVENKENKENNEKRKTDP